MQVAVVTPYFREPAATLLRCHLSVARQSYVCSHIMVADGHAVTEPDGWNVDHVRLPRSHNDIGSTPRLIGAYHAIGLGVDAVAFLDADNWFRDDHIGSLIGLHQRTGAAFLSSGRSLCRLDGSFMAACRNTHPDRFIDTNCMMFTRDAYPLLAHWALMPPYAHVLGDRVMLYHVKRSGLSRAHSDANSVYYCCGKAGIYRELGEVVPDGVQPKPDYETAAALWLADGRPPLL